jgi:hypothetical protein
MEQNTDSAFFSRLSTWLKSRTRRQSLSVQGRVDDSPGWTGLSGLPHDYDLSRQQELYADALSAWRKNPIAWRIIAITTDFVVGDSLHLSSPDPALDSFLRRFWSHPQNLLDLRLEALCDELSRAGDLFIVLFRNPQDGMSYLRMVTKDRIARIETFENDWEQEIAYYELQPSGEPRRWLSPLHPESSQSESVMLHYAVNRPVGALLGEGDLTSMIPWLQRYSRMLEDRVRLHWAVRTFLWIVNVPSNLVASKREQYRNPPDTGSIIVKDESETWQAVAPDLRGQDARWDLQAVRGMIDAGSGYPPHWRGEAGDANLATATAMQGPTERHLLRRQRYFIYLLEDLVFQAYLRAVQIGSEPSLATAIVGAGLQARNVTKPDPERPAHDDRDYSHLFTAVVPEISRWDNESLARAAHDLAQAMSLAADRLPGRSPTFDALALSLVARFAGEPQPREVIARILEEANQKEI